MPRRRKFHVPCTTKVPSISQSTSRVLNSAETSSLQHDQAVYDPTLRPSSSVDDNVKPRTRYRTALAVLATIVVVAVGFALTRGGPPATSGALIPAGQRDLAQGFDGATGWINSPPQTLAQLKGKVVLVDFWTFSCVNCVRTLPHLQALYAKYRDHGLVIIGVHSPEFDFEKNSKNVATAVSRLGVVWPVALDSSLNIWTAYNNHFWPAEYLIDQNGKIAYTNFGEGNYDATVQAVQALLSVPAATLQVSTQTLSDPGTATPEVYVGSDRGQDYGLANGETYPAVGSTVTYPE